MLRPNPHHPSDALLQRDKSVRLSRYFMPVLKETPGEAQVISHQLMLRAAMVRQTSSGIYAWLPLGKRVLANIERIVREEQDRAGAIEVLMPTIQKAGIDPIWFGIFVVLVVEMAQITPPVGFNLFVLQGMTGRDLTWIARVTMPMFFLMCAAVLLTWLFPAIVTWLPQQMSR